jgi:TPR repeat protein
MRIAALLLAACVSAGAGAGDGNASALRRPHGASPQAGALAELRHAAETGDMKAAYRLGLSYRNGMGVALDKALAVQWLGVAARGQVPAAMFTLSNMLADGEGAAKDEAAARRWLEAAAELEYPEALQQMALSESDPARAAQLMREAAHAMTHRVREP